MADRSTAQLQYRRYIIEPEFKLTDAPGSRMLLPSCFRLDCIPLTAAVLWGK